MPAHQLSDPSAEHPLGRSISVGKPALSVHFGNAGRREGEQAGKPRFSGPSSVFGPVAFPFACRECRRHAIENGTYLAHPLGQAT